MKKISSIIANLLIFSQLAFSQNGIITPNGVVFPQFTDAARPTNNIILGTMIFNKTSGKHQFWNGTAWADVCNCSTPRSTFYVQGRNLYDPCGKQIILRGINKMNVWTDDVGASFPEIAKTGANCVRIVWTITNNGQPTSDVKLDTLIARCIRQKMIPIIEIHDATCNLSLLQTVVNYWKRPAIVAIINKYKNALLVNIANESGDYQVTSSQFTTAYISVVQQMRRAGITVPLIIDGMDCGKNLDRLVQDAPSILTSDSLSNTLFSVHTYWGISDGADHNFITTEFQNAVNSNIPFIIGELSKYGAYISGNSSVCNATAAIDYSWIIAESQRLNIGWVSWEWGPGNTGGGDPLCVAMDMTTSSTYATLKDWGLDISVTNINSIKNTSIKTPYILTGFKSCGN